MYAFMGGTGHDQLDFNQLTKIAEERTVFSYSLRHFLRFPTTAIFLGPNTFHGALF
jgi:hypothetical protein